MFELRTETSSQWVKCVLEHFDNFLLDHASCEKKASGMAVSLLSHYPDKAYLVTKMIELALEEMNHFRQVVALIHERQGQLAADTKDPYIRQLAQQVRNGSDYYLMDRLLIAGIVEKRGHERFGLIADALPQGNLKTFYQVITRSEGKHFELFIDIAQQYFSKDAIDKRIDELLDAEASITDKLTIRPALH